MTSSFLHISGVRLSGKASLGPKIGRVRRGGKPSGVDGDGDGFVSGVDGEDNIPVVGAIKLDRSLGDDGFELFVQMIANGYKMDGSGKMSEQEIERLRKRDDLKDLFSIVDKWSSVIRERQKVVNSLPDGEEKRKMKKKVDEARAEFRRELIDTVEKKFKSLIDDDENSVFIQVGMGALSGILSSSGFRVMGQDGAINPINVGDEATRVRKETEREMFGISLDSVERPVYGYLWRGDEGAVWRRDERSIGLLDPRAVIGLYGNIAVRLKQGVKGRSTVTVGDSVGNDGNVSAVKIGEPNISAVGINAAWVMRANNVNDVNRNGVDYIEAQVHGGIKVEDIDEVIVPQKIYEWSRLDPADYPEYPKDIGEIDRGTVQSAIELLEALRKSKIKFRLV